jgi:hypothetical protein
MKFKRVYQIEEGSTFILSRGCSPAPASPGEAGGDLTFPRIDREAGANHCRLYQSNSFPPDSIIEWKGESVMPSLNPSKRIDQEIADHPDWRGHILSEIRQLVLSSDKDIIEEWKWMGTPTWSCNGLICVANIHKNMVKVTFYQGAHIPDPEKQFNAGLEGNMWRAINYLEGDKIRKRGFQKLVRESIALNQKKKKKI